MIHLHKHDLPSNLNLGPAVAIDTETMGLNPARDRLCLVQLSSGDGTSHLVQIPKLSPGQAHDAPRLKAMLTNPNVLKIFHFARFDLAAMKTYLGVRCAPVYCTKIASKMTRSYT